MRKYFATRRGRDTLNVIFSIGAAIVIFGALAKIEHWPGALGHALEIGMITETAVFLLMALIPAEKEFHWDRFFPNITESPEEERNRTGKYLSTPIALGGGSGNPALQQLDEMLAQAEITPANLKKLSDGFEKLGTTVSSMTDIGDAVTATGDYTSKTRETTLALLTMKDAYNNAAHAASNFNTTSEATLQLHEQIQGMTQNLSSLNAIYELELKDTNNHLEVMSDFYSNMANASESMSHSVDNAKKTQEQIAMLARNLSNLNAIYGNMLSAMQGRQ